MIKQLSLRSFDKNFTYFIWDKDSMELAIIDPHDADNLIAEINIGGFDLKKILISHGHFDHVEGVFRLVEEFPNVEIVMHEKTFSKFDFGKMNVRFVEDLDIVEISEIELNVIYTPGHSDDALCFYIKKGKGALFTGDTLFVEGCGRVDLPTSDAKELFKSLQRIKKLPLTTVLYTGHDYGSSPKSNIARELKNNVYLKADRFEEFMKLLGKHKSPF